MPDVADAEPDKPQAANLELTVLMPCLNEAETVTACVRKAVGFLADHSIDGEVVVADNGSTDGSQWLAAHAGARVVSVAEPGYGSALLGGIMAARGQYVIMGDADDSYDFSALTPFVSRLRAGVDLVMGNRFTGGIKPGAMPALHRYLGNPVLSFIGRLFFRVKVGDFHCGLRGFRRDSALSLGLQTSGMEFASEMVVRATLAGQHVEEVPTTLSPDGRSRPPHLRSWRDGWRHLRFLLLFSPRWLFLIPGIVLLALGLIIGAAVLPARLPVGGITYRREHTRCRMRDGGDRLPGCAVCPVSPRFMAVRRDSCRRIPRSAGCCGSGAWNAGYGLAACLRAPAPQAWRRRLPGGITSASVLSTLRPRYALCCPR